MRKQTPKLDWQIAENEAEWEHHQALLAPETAPLTGYRLLLKKYLGSSITLVLFLALVGDWWWRAANPDHRATQATIISQTAPTTGATALAALVTTVEQHRPNRLSYQYEGASYQYGMESRVTSQANHRAGPEADLDVKVYTVNVEGDQAVVNIRMNDQRGKPIYRQTRFYRHTSAGWQPAPPDANLWGAERSLATPYFIYHFGEQDEATILAVAPQMDALYITLQRNFGLSIDPPSAKLVIDVRVTQRPGRATVFDTTNHVSVASPAVYLAPVELTDAALLAQSLAFPLLAHRVAQARRQHMIGESWLSLLNGLSLWQMWDLDLPLAAWRTDVVQWLYTDLLRTEFGQAVVLPVRYSELCASHKLWLWSPLPMHIPLLCTERQWETANLRLWATGAPLTTLAQLAIPLPATVDESAWRSHHPGEAVALATLIDYAVTNYGRDRLPALVAGLGQYKSWEELLPAVFGVSPAEFEAGWQRYLAARYGVVMAQP